MMPKKIQIEWENKEYGLLIDKLKDIYNIRTEKEIANILEIAPSQLSAMKKGNNFPYKQYISFAVKEGISLDNLFGLDDNFNDKTVNIQCEEILDDTRIPFYPDEAKFISIPYLPQNAEKTLRVIKQNNFYQIIDVSKTDILDSGNYALMVNDFILIRRIEIRLQNIIIQNAEWREAEDVVTVSFEEFSQFKVFGKVIALLTVEQLND